MAGKKGKLHDREYIRFYYGINNGTLADETVWLQRDGILVAERRNPL